MVSKLVGDHSLSSLRPQSPNLAFERSLEGRTTAHVLYALCGRHFRTVKHCTVLHNNTTKYSKYSTLLSLSSQKILTIVQERLQLYREILTC